MKLTDLYESDSKLFKAKDLNGKAVRLRIESWETVVFKEGDKPKLVLHFKGKEQGFACNVTNGKIIAANFGTEDFDDWIGKTITIYPGKTKYDGKEVPCLKVKDELPEMEVVDEVDVPDTEDDIPF